MTKTRHTDARSLTNITLHMCELNLKPQGKQEFTCKVVENLREFVLKLKPPTHK